MISSLESFLNNFSVRKKSPREVVAALRAAIERAEKVDDGQEKAIKDVSKAISSIKLELFGNAERTPNEQDIRAFAKMACETDLLVLLASHLNIMEFETRKSTVMVFNNLLKQEYSGPPLMPVLENIVVSQGDQIRSALMAGYDSNETTLISGAMLRECLRDEAFTKKMLQSNDFWRFFTLVEVSDFDVASDAFQSFRDILTLHQKPVATFIEGEFDKFFDHYNNLLRSSNYVARRQSLKLLGEMLMDRFNIEIMKRYIASAENLKLAMNLLLDKRKKIQFEAFHVFKVFVANPNKPPAVKAILVKNREKMLEYLSQFLTDRNDDEINEEFHEERQMIIEEIRDL